MKVQLCGGRPPESAEPNGRVCSICLLPKEEELLCLVCSHAHEQLTQIQSEPDYGSSLMRVIESLKLWSQEMPTWNDLYWLHRLLQPSITRGRRMSGPRQGLFIVLEGIDGSGKSFHMDAVQEVLAFRSVLYTRWYSQTIAPDWTIFETMSSSRTTL